MAERGDEAEEHFDEERGELTEQDLLEMKRLPTRTSPSVLSLADSSSNFGEHVPDEVMDDVENVEEEELNAMRQARIYGGFMFDRERQVEVDLPETVKVLDWPFPIPPCPPHEDEKKWEDVFRHSKVYLVGTAHFSKESQEDVRRTISIVQPDVVMVELCPSRITILSLDEETLLREAQSMNASRMLQLVTSGGPLHGVLYCLLISMSAHVTRELGMAPGGEFRCAYRESSKVPFCQFILGDRPIEVTIGRALRSLSLWQKMRFFYHLVASHNMKITPEEVEKCKKADVLEQLLAEMADDFPGLSEIFVGERDQYMAKGLMNLLAANTVRKRGAWQHTDGVEWQPLRVVSVVGIGHAPGIAQWWGKEVDIQPLLHVAPPTATEQALRFGIRWGVRLALAYGLYRASRAVYRRVV